MKEGMMRIIGVVCVIAMSFAGMGAIFRECASGRSSNMTMKEQDTTNKPEANRGQAIEFKELTSVKGTTKDGAPFSTQIYESTTAVRVSVTRENRDSAARASKELQKRIKPAVEIIERGPKLDETGQRVGERVVATFAKSDSSGNEVTVLWTNSGQLYYIQSTSLPVALEFEKKFYR
jgi:hypothetical protein